MKLPRLSIKAENNKGFTLIEMLVAVTLFTIVMFVSVGTLLALVGANRKAQALQSVMNNLNVSLDSMVRAIREGSEYDCNGGNCDYPGGETFSFKPSHGGDGDRWTYYANLGDGRIYKLKEGSDAGEYPLTAPEITIDSLKFYVIGTDPGDAVQPKVVVVVRGTAGANSVKTTTEFLIQATAVPRVLDIP